MLQMLILKVSDFFNLLGLPREIQSDVVVCRPHPPSWSLLFSFLGFVLRSIFWQPAAARGGRSCGFGEEVGVLGQVVYLIGLFFFLVLIGAFLGFSFLVLAWAFPLWRF